MVEGTPVRTPTRCENNDVLTRISIPAACRLELMSCLQSWRMMSRRRRVPKKPLPLSVSRGSEYNAWAWTTAGHTHQHRDWADAVREARGVFELTCAHLHLCVCELILRQECCDLGLSRLHVAALGQQLIDSGQEIGGSVWAQVFFF